MTELIWEGKYKPGADGKMVKQGPLRVALPFQTVETVNESAPPHRKIGACPTDATTAHGV